MPKYQIRVDNRDQMLGMAWISAWSPCVSVHDQNGQWVDLGNVTVTSNDPTFTPITFFMTGRACFEHAFSIYTGSGAPLTLTVTPTEDPDSNFTFNIRTYAHLNFEPTPQYVRPGETFQIDVFATTSPGSTTVFTEAVDRVALVPFPYFYTAPTPTPVGDFKSYEDRQSGCKALVGGRASFSGSLGPEGFYYLRAIYCDSLTADTSQSSDALIVGDPVAIPSPGTAGIATVATVATTVAAATTTVTPTTSSSSSAAPASSKNTGGVRWYIPVGAVLGGIVLFAVIGALVYVLIIRAKRDTNDYVLRT